MSSSSATASPVQIFSPEDKPYGLSYEEHIQNFWRWQISIPGRPKSEHPMFDKTGAKWSKRQSHPKLPVIYLSGAGGRKVHRKCTIPPDKSILIPVMTMVATDSEYPNSTKDLDDIAREDQDNVNDLSLNINGKEYTLADLNKFRNHTSNFEVIYPEGGIFGVSKAGRSKAVADGYYLLTKPLAPDRYTIRFKGTIPSIKFEEDINYTLIAK